MSQMDAEEELARAATDLALSLIGRVSFCHGTICSCCHMGSLGQTDEIDHVPSCRVGRVLRAVQALERTPLEREFLEAEARSPQPLEFPVVEMPRPAWFDQQSDGVENDRERRG